MRVFKRFHRALGARVVVSGATLVALAGCETLPSQSRPSTGNIERAVSQSVNNILGQGGKNLLSVFNGTCSKLKSWASSAGPIPANPQVSQLLPYVQDAVFEKHFGKRYDQLTVADFRESQRDQSQCRRDGTLTPAEDQLAQRVWNQSVQTALVAQLQRARAERETLSALADELDRLPASEQGYARLEEIRQSRQRQRAGAESAGGESIQSKIRQAEERIAPAVFQARIDRALAAAAGPGDLQGLLRLDGQLRAARLPEAQSGQLGARLKVRIGELDAQAARQEQASSPLFREPGFGLDQVVAARQWMVDFQNRYRATLSSTPALNAVWSDAQERRRRQLDRAQATLSEQIKQSKNASELSSFADRYFTSEETTGVSGSLRAQAAAKIDTVNQAERNRQVFGDQANVQAVSTRATPSAVPVNRCDQLAADPDDATRVASGVPDEAIKSSAAVAACTEALKAHPNEARFAFQLGRALLAGGKEAAAVQAFAAASQEGHAGAMVYLGMAMSEGAGGLPKDPAKGEQLQAMGERAGYRTGQPMASPAASQRAVSPPTKSPTAAGQIAGNYNMPHIVQAIYQADLSKLDRDSKTNTSYLLSQARVLASDPTCRVFLQRDVDAWATKQARGLVNAIKPEQMLSDMAKGMQIILQNPMEAAVTMGASDQHYANLPDYAVSDLMEFVQSVGPCKSAPFNRYTANLRSYLERGVTSGR